MEGVAFQKKTKPKEILTWIKLNNSQSRINGRGRRGVRGPKQ